jgi:hypothetical protein
MEAAADSSTDAMGVALTAPAAPTAPMTSTATTAAIAKPKAKVKKELTTAEREVQNQKRQARQMAEWARKAEALTVALEEEKRECLTIMAARAQVQEAMKVRELLGEAKTDVVAGTTLSSSVMSQALRPLMVSWSPVTPGEEAAPGLHVHTLF